MQSFLQALNSVGQDGSGSGIYGQIFDADGSRNGSEFQVNTYTAGDQEGPVVTSFSDSSFLIVWWSQDQDGSAWGVYGQRYSVDGYPLGDEFRVNTNTFGNQYYPNATRLSDDGFLITWSSDAIDDSGLGVSGQLYAADGNAFGDEFRINSYTQNDQYTPSSALLSDGTLVVVWRSKGQDGSSHGVYGQRFTPEGSPLGDEFRVNTTVRGDQSQPYIASLPDGDFVVVYRSQNVDRDSYGVVGQLFSTQTYTESSPPATTTPSQVTGNNTEVPLITDLAEGQYSLTAIADVFGSIMFLDGLTETVAETSHTIEYQGVSFDYAEVDGIITTVVRDGEFTTEFAAEISESFESAAGISYSTALVLVGQPNIESTLMMVAGADGNYVG